MELVFRHLPSGNPSSLAVDEIDLRLQLPRYRGRRDLAMFVVENGVEGCARGDGPEYRRLILPPDPILDDMLAATFVEQLLAGKKLPPRGARIFARYADLARQGWWLGKLPPQDSVQGMYLAMRRTGGDLTQAEAGVRFADDWFSRMAPVLRRAIRKGLDPRADPLFASDMAFAEEQAFLEHDHKRYAEDVRLGQRWLATLEGKQGMPPVEVPALFLCRPQSILWKYWARSQQKELEGRSYVFLAVRSDQPWPWVFSTDPVSELPIKGLAVVLQKAEKAKALPGAAEDPWYDGKRHQHTLVAAPHNGTALGDDEVLQIVKDWTGARSFPSAERNDDLHKPAWKKPALGKRSALVLGLIGAVLGLLVWPLFSPNQVSSKQDRSVDRDDLPEEVSGLPSMPALYLLAIGISDYDAPESGLKYADRDAKDLVKEYEELKNKKEVFREFHLHPPLTNKRATRANIRHELVKLEDEVRRNKSGNELVVVTFAGHGRLDDGEFSFIPSNYDPKNELDEVVSWNDILSPLRHLPCTVLVFMDTCHSGNITKNLVQGEARMVVIAACKGKENSRENEEWGGGHGAFTFAFLEVLRGQVSIPPSRHNGNFISLDELYDHLKRRVNQLVPGHQAPIYNHTGDMDPDDIPIAARRPVTLAGGK